MSGSLLPTADVSSYPSAHQPAAGGAAANPLTSVMGAVHSFAETQNLMNQNQLFQQQFQARQALGPIFQHSIDPETGQPDINKFLIGVASHPATAFMAGDMWNQAINRQNTQASMLKTQAETSQLQYDRIAQTAAGVLASAPRGPNGQPMVTHDATLKAVSSAAAMGYFPKDQALSFLSNIQSMDGPALTQHLTQIATASKTAAETLRNTMGSIDLPNLGGRVQPVATSPVQGTATPLGGPGASLQTTMTPEQGNSLVPGHDITGAPTMTPRGALPTVPGTVERPPGGATPLGAPGTPSPTVRTGNPAQVQEYLEGKGQIATQYEPDLNTRANNAQQAIQTFKEQIGLMFNPDGTTKIGAGAGAGIWTAVARAAQALHAPQELVDKLQGGDLAAAQQFEKLVLGNAIRTLRQSLGGDGRLAVTEFEQQMEKGTPNLSMDPKAVLGMTKFMDVLQRQVLAEQQGFQRFIADGQKNGWKEGTPNAYPAMWNEYLRKNGFLSKLPQLGGQIAKQVLQPSGGQ